MVYGARVEKARMELVETRDTAHPHCRLQFVVQDCEERIISNTIGNQRIIRIVRCMKTLVGRQGRAGQGRYMRMVKDDEDGEDGKTKRRGKNPAK